MSTPPATSAPPGETRSRRVSSAAGLPRSRMAPATAPWRGRPGKLPRSPSNESESARTSAVMAKVSVRVSSAIVPTTVLAGRAPSSWTSVPANRASCSVPLTEPERRSAPCRTTLGTSRRTVARLITAACTAKGATRGPSGARTSRRPCPRTWERGVPGTRESLNCQSIDAATLSTGPSATVRPDSQPANGNVSKSPRGKSKSMSSARTSTPSNATTPESDALRMPNRPASVPPA